MTDHTFPSVFFIYLFIFIVAFGALFFFIRSYKDGYWGKDSEEVKYRMLEDDDNGGEDGRKQRK